MNEGIATIGPIDATWGASAIEARVYPVVALFAANVIHDAVPAIGGGSAIVVAAAASADIEVGSEIAGLIWSDDTVTTDRATLGLASEEVVERQPVV